MSSIIEFYNQVDEEQRFARNSRAIEWFTTIKILEEQISPPQSILELGAGRGAYALHYAALGHAVTALDLTPSNVEVIRQRARERSLVLDAVEGDATDLSPFADASFQHVLMLGPYYHVTDEKARARLLQEAIRVLQPGGLLAIAYINKFSVVPMLVKKLPAYMRQATLKHVMDRGYLKGDDPDNFWIDSYYTTPEEIERTITALKLTIVDHVATDGLSHTIDQEVDALDEQQYELYRSYHLATCRERSMLGISTHGLLLARKD
ncbi:class I SAM-dependent methyltransferase [Paenibacillus septentrionalis]|uniref:Class I SAM-dependent methyltransferase n=1 Tax=Paenibacillus septentrionalis TaxID=429342 RepID=A0ABW1V6E6_9BACL